MPLVGGGGPPTDTAPAYTGRFAGTLSPRLIEARKTGKIDMTFPPGAVSDAWRRNDPQQVGIAHLVLMRRMILADPTGCGKTPEALIAWALIRAKKQWPALVLATKSNLTPWKEKAELFIPGVKAAVYHDTDRAETLDQKHDLLITTYDTAASDTEMLRQYYGGSPPVVMLDEAHRLRGWGESRHARDDAGNRIKIEAVVRPTLSKLFEDSEYMWALTATPEFSDFGETAALLEFLIPGFFGGSKGFDDRYVKKRLVKFGKRRVYLKPTKLNHYQNLGEYHSRVAPYVLRRPDSAFGDVLPSVDWREIWTPLSPAHKRVYLSVKNKLVEVKNAEGELQEATHAHLQQASDAPEVLGLTMPGIPAKFKALVDLCKGELRLDKVIVYSKWRGVAQWLEKSLKTAHVPVFGIIDGDTPQAQRDRTRQRFQQAPESGVLLITNAGSESLDLEAARAVVLYNLPWTMGELKQVVGRARRFGSVHRSVLVYVLGHESTSDVRDQQRLQLKHTITTTSESATTTPAKSAAVSTTDSENPSASRTETTPKNAPENAKTTNSPLVAAIATNAMSTTNNPSLRGGYDLDLIDLPPSHAALADSLSTRVSDAPPPEAAGS